MKILIEDAETLEYLTVDGHWTKVVADSKRFGGTKLAFEVAKKEPIGKFNIVCYIKETNQFINLDHGRGKGVEAIAA
jgi:hypothetical protein